MKNKYTVKAGDTKSSLKARFGIDINDSQFRSKDPNKLFAGEVLTIPSKNPVATPSMISGNSVDLSKVVTDKKPTNTPPSSSLRDISIGFSPNATDAQLQEISNRDPALAEKIANRKNTPGIIPSEFVNPTPETPKEKLRKESDILQEEIFKLEKNIANKSDNRTGALDEAGVFEDLQALNELKAKQRLAEDREIEIGIEARQNLRGKQATKTEFNASVRPALENNALDQLAASRAASSLAESIQTNIAVIDSKLDAQFEKDKFILEQKINRLTTVQKAHADIITAEQAQQLETQKFKQQLILKNIEFENGVRKDFLKDFAVLGLSSTELNDALNGSIGDLYQLRSDKTGTYNWENIDRGTGIQLFQGPELERFLQFKDNEVVLDEEEKALGVLATDSASLINTIELMLDNPDGLGDVTGGGLFGIGRANFFEDAKSQSFLNNGSQLIKSLTLTSLQEAIANGATFGALSNAELALVAGASNNLGADVDPETGALKGFASGEQDLQDNLEILQLGFMKTYLQATDAEGYAAKGIRDIEAYDADGNKNEAAYETIKDLYKAARENPRAAIDSNPAASELDDAGNLKVAFDLIAQEEGFRGEAYLDSTGTPTIGFGTTTIGGRPVKLGDKLTRAQSTAIMQNQIVENYTNFADQLSVDINPAQFAALTSFEYNLGPGVWNDTTGQQILAFINQNKLKEAGQLMQLYNKSRNPNGNLAYNPVLAGRRAREAQLLMA